MTKTGAVAAVTFTGVLAWFTLLAPLARTVVADGAAQPSLVLFGTRSASGAGSADSGETLAVAPTGELLVSGTANGRGSDAGGSYSEPMLAAFDRSGALRWQQTYSRPREQIVAIDTSSGEIRVVFLAKARGDTAAGSLEVWAVGPGGVLARMLDRRRYAPFSGVSVHRDFEGSLLILSHPTEDEPFGRELRWTSWRVGRDGALTMRAESGFMSHTGSLAAVEGALLAFRSRSRDGAQFVWLDEALTGSRTVKIRNCNVCRPVAAVSDGSTAFVIVRNIRPRGAPETFDLLRLSPGDARIEFRRALPALVHSRPYGMSLAGDGDLYVFGDSFDQPFIARLSANGALRWLRRFATGRHGGYLNDLLVLSDGTLAATGRTLQKGVSFVTRDDDAFMVIASDPARDLEALGACLDAAGTLPQLYETLGERLGVALRNSHYYLEMRNASCDDRPERSALPRRIAPASHCPRYSERRRLDFLLALERATADAGSVARIAHNYRMRLVFVGDEALDGAAFAYRHAGGSTRGAAPAMAMDIDRPAAIAAELQRQVTHLPALAAHAAWFWENGSIFLGNGRRGHASGPTEPAYSPREARALVEQLRAGMEAMDVESRAVVARYASDSLQVALDPTAESFEYRSGRFVVPGAAAGEAWEWLLSQAAALEPEIAALEGELADRRRVRFSQRPRIEPEHYLVILRHVTSVLAQTPPPGETIVVDLDVAGDRTYFYVAGRQVAETVALRSPAELARWIAHVSASCGCD